MAEITKYFFEKNLDVLTQLHHYAPNDSQLLNIPHSMMALDPFLLVFNSPPIQDVRKGALLFSYLRSINTTLAITIAAYSFIIGNYNKQPNNDYEVILHSEILTLYQSSLRDFIANLKVAVDQMLVVLATKHSAKYDCIGGFLKQLHKYENLKCLEFFFLKLNTAANYLKHHVDQLESFQEIHFIGLKLRVMVAKKEDYKNLCKYLTITEIIEKTEKEIVYYLDLAALTAEFNKFKALFLEELAAPKRHHL
ncbi:hypothetical protein [Legionella bozemanae]|uniref:hypothetical protein n=1 Tax=Legionella bozemanae TaxID=447 RepID=UPI001040E502|nr:hypothetical protein [Legionella bozemanae]